MRKVLLTSRCFKKISTLAVLSVSLTVSLAWAQPNTLVMASTTSTEQSGLFSYLLPAFKKVSGIDVKVVAVGTGQAIDMGRRGDADLLFVHDQVAEEKIVAEGHVLKRFPVMYNDFVLAGPALDPAQVKGKDIVQAFNKLHLVNADFVSRGDKSGTNAAELRYWKSAGVEAPAGKPGFVNYKACGCGMGQALNMAASTGSYVLVDRGSWLAFKNRADLTVLVEGDKLLFNQYGVMAVNPAMHPQAKLAQAQQFVDWIITPAGQGVIASYKINGQQLFFPNAAP
jgi:tungstate transport system substrate-binding protein